MRYWEGLTQTVNFGGHSLAYNRLVFGAGWIRVGDIPTHCPYWDSSLGICVVSSKLLTIKFHTSSHRNPFTEWSGTIWASTVFTPGWDTRTLLVTPQPDPATLILRPGVCNMLQDASFSSAGPTKWLPCPKLSLKVLGLPVLDPA